MSVKNAIHRYQYRYSVALNYDTPQKKTIIRVLIGQWSYNIGQGSFGIDVLNKKKHIRKILSRIRVQYENVKAYCYWTKRDHKMLSYYVAKSMIDVPPSRLCAVLLFIDATERPRTSTETMAQRRNDGEHGSWLFRIPIIIT